MVCISQAVLQPAAAFKMAESPQHREPLRLKNSLRVPSFLQLQFTHHYKQRDNLILMG